MHLHASMETSPSNHHAMGKKVKFKSKESIFSVQETNCINLCEKSKGWVANPKLARIEAIVLHEALYSIIVNTEPVIKIIAGNCSKRRREISDQYQFLYEKDLSSDLNIKLRRGLFKDLVINVFMPLPEFYAKEIRSTFGTFRHQREVLINLLINMEPEILSETNLTYIKLYDMSIESDIKCNIRSGHYQRLLILLVLNRRSKDDEEIDEDMIKKDVQDLFQQGEGKLGTNNDLFVDIMTLRSKTYLKKLFEEYKKHAGNGFYECIHREFSFTLKKALHEIVRVVEDQEGSLADDLRDCVAGIGTSNKKLIRLIVTLAESERLVKVKAIFKERFGTSLEQSISDDTSGDFRGFLLALLGISVYDDQQRIEPSYY